jgi:hypothetical protein
VEVVVVVVVVVLVEGAGLGGALPAARTIVKSVMKQVIF